MSLPISVHAVAKAGPTGRINLSKLREIGFAANRRLLEVERLSDDCILAEDRFQHINNPVSVNGQRASGLRFADPRVHPLWHAIILFRLLADGFRAADLRPYLAALAGRSPDTVPPGAVTYQLRRLRLHGMIERIPRSHRYRVTDAGLRTALFFIRLYNRLLRPGLAASFNHHRWQIRSPNLTHSQKIPSTEAELREMLPTAWRFAVLMDRTIVSPARFRALEGGARALGVQLQTVNVHSPADFAAALETLHAGGTEAVNILPRPHFSPPSTSSEHSLRCTTCRRFAHHGRWPSLGDWQVMQPSCTSFPAPSPTLPTRC